MNLDDLKKMSADNLTHFKALAESNLAQKVLEIARVDIQAAVDKDRKNAEKESIESNIQKIVTALAFVQAE